MTNIQEQNPLNPQSFKKHSQKSNISKKFSKLLKLIENMLLNALPSTHATCCQ